MNKRQRKKHRLGEFTELGFELRFCTPGTWTDQQQEAFWAECIGRIEALGLALGGGIGSCWDVFVMSLKERTTVTPEQRQALLDWLGAHPAVTDVRAGSLENAWHEPVGSRGATA